LKEQPAYTFKKSERLSEKKKIDALFSRGRSFSMFPFRVLWLPENDEAILQAGVGVSTRHFKKATDRNRIKRMMRECYRLRKHSLINVLDGNNRRMSVFILYNSPDMPDFEQVCLKMDKIIGRLSKAADENNQ